MTIELPSLDQLTAVLLLREYNTRVVVIGVTLLGMAAGLIGTFMLLRKRALLGDALSHATLPGIGIAFLVMSTAGAEGKWLPGLLAGAAISGTLAVLAILGIVHSSRIKQDAALGIVLSTFFGLGVVVLGIITRMGAGNAAGLNSFIYGKTAAMLWSDAVLIAAAAGLVALLCLLLFKEFAGLCFDQAYSASQGAPVVLLDTLMMALVVIVTVIGLQAVGLILVIALLVIPPAAARFWTEHLPTMLIGSALIGGASGYLGAALSALLPRLPAGAVIVLVAGGLFLLSMVLGAARGVVVRTIRQQRLVRKIARQNLLRAMHELSESRPAAPGVARAELLRARSWSPLELNWSAWSAERAGLIRRRAGERLELTAAGQAAAARIVRNHRLWEMYLISHADIAPSHVDRDADAVEHVLSPEMIAELERRIAGAAEVPSPHALPAGAAQPAGAGR